MSEVPLYLETPSPRQSLLEPKLYSLNPTPYTLHRAP